MGLPGAHLPLVLFDPRALGGRQRRRRAGRELGGPPAEVGPVLAALQELEQDFDPLAVAQLIAGGRGAHGGGGQVDGQAGAFGAVGLAIPLDDDPHRLVQTINLTLGLQPIAQDFLDLLAGGRGGGAAGHWLPGGVVFRELGQDGQRALDRMPLCLGTERAQHNTCKPSCRA